MATVLAFLGPVSRSGKSTAAMAVSRYVAERGYRVVLVDLDRQARLTRAHFVKGSEPVEVGVPGTIASSFEKSSLGSLRVRELMPGVELAPGSLGLTSVLRDQLARSNRFEFPISKGRPVNVALDKVTPRQRFDHIVEQLSDQRDMVVLDLGPGLDELAAWASARAGWTIFPIHGGPLATFAIGQSVGFATACEVENARLFFNSVVDSSSLPIEGASLRIVDRMPEGVGRRITSLSPTAIRAFVAAIDPDGSVLPR